MKLFDFNKKIYIIQKQTEFITQIKRSMNYQINLMIEHSNGAGGNVTSTLRIEYEQPVQDEYLGFVWEEKPSDEQVSDGVLHILRIHANCIKTEWIEKNRFTGKFVAVDTIHGGISELRIRLGECAWKLSHPIPINE